MKTQPTPRPGSHRINFHSIIRIGTLVASIVLIAIPLFSTSSASFPGRSSKAGDRMAAPAGETGPGSTGADANRRVAFASKQLFSPNVGLTTIFPLVLPQAPPPPPSIATFASDGTTCGAAKTEFNLSSSTVPVYVCATVTSSGGAASRRRITWQDPDGFVRQTTAVSSDPQNDHFLIPDTATSTLSNGQVVNNVGKWRVSLVGRSLVTYATFVVKDPNTATADLSITKTAPSNSQEVAAGSPGSFDIYVQNSGPDDAATVTVTDHVPDNTTFVSLLQTSGQATSQFTCNQTVVSGNVTCSIATFTAGSFATFQFIYTVNVGTAAGTAITNTVSIGSATHELNNADNSATASASVSGTPSTGTCSVACPDNISIPANTHQDPMDPNSTPGAVVHFSPPSGNTECGVIVVDHCNDCFFPQGTTVVTATGVGDSCSFTVTVTPSGSAPTIICPANKTADASGDACEANVNVGTPTVSGSNVTFHGVRSDGKPMYDCDCFPNSPNQTDDACNVNGNCTRRTDAPFPAGETTITWIAYSHDIAGPFATPQDEETHRTGGASCTQTITVNDVTPPVIAATDSSASADANCQAPVPDYSGTVSDNCACSNSDTSEACQGHPHFTVTQTPAAGTMVGAGPHTVHIEANDHSSNNNGAGNTSTKDVTFTVNDITPPSITCPADISLPNIPGTCNASVSLGVATATDSCDGTITPVPSRSDNKPITDPFPVGNTTITWTATDSAGNSSSCNQHVIVTDNENPTITCPANITTNTDPGTCSANVNPGTATATDNCDTGSPTITGTRSDGQALNAPYPKGTTTIHWTATDSAGNSSSCDQTVTVNDNEAPAISCPANITRGTDPGTCSANINPGTATATDNCDNPTVTGTRSDSQPLNAPYPKGTTTITWTASDSSGNHSSCTQTITVNDTEPPAIACPANMTANTLPGTCSAIVIVGVATASDNCDTLVVPTGTRSDNQPLVALYPKGTTTITWTATDAAGNQSSCTQTVTVEDHEAPTITFNGQTPSMWPPNHSYHTFTAANFISSVNDNCDTLNVSDVDIVSATSDEPENGGGDGNTLNDIIIASNCKSIQLRAERQNSADGRVYTITFRLRDTSGNTTTGTAKVYAPKNQGQTPVDSGPHYTVTGNCP